MGSIGPELLGRLFDAHAPALRLYARQWCDGTDADDAVQDAFMNLARQAVLPEQVGAWLHKVVRNAALSAARSRGRRQRREATASTCEAWFSAVDDQLDARSATRHLAELAPESREVIVARLWGGLTFDQIARLQGCSITTAHRRYHDGLSRLHERLERPCSTGMKNGPNR
jgi:RNA polymerase sigma-70 factor (ECF subfamily)